MSIDGEIVVWNGLFLSYTPVVINSVSTLFSLDAQIKRFTGSPIRLAYQPARMLPKLPVGTEKFSGAPGAIRPAFTKSQYAEK